MEGGCDGGVGMSSLAGGVAFGKAGHTARGHRRFVNPNHSMEWAGDASASPGRWKPNPSHMAMAYCTGPLKQSPKR